MNDLKDAEDYFIRNRKDVIAVILTREQWADILLNLGPTDSTQEIYEKIEKQL